MITIAHIYFPDGTSESYFAKSEGTKTKNCDVITLRFRDSNQSLVIIDGNTERMFINVGFEIVTTK